VNGYETDYAFTIGQVVATEPTIPAIKSLLRGTVVGEVAKISLNHGIQFKFDVVIYGSVEYQAVRGTSALNVYDTETGKSTFLGVTKPGIRWEQTGKTMISVQKIYRGYEINY